MVIGLGEWSLAFFHTCFTSSTLPPGGKPEHEQRAEELAFSCKSQKLSKTKDLYTDNGLDYNSFERDSALCL